MTQMATINSGNVLNPHITSVPVDGITMSIDLHGVNDYRLHISPWGSASVVYTTEAAALDALKAAMLAVTVIDATSY